MTINLELNKIYQQDCIQGMKGIGGGTIDLIVTDPPYLVEYKTNHRKDKDHKFRTTIQGDNNPQLIKDYIKECHRIMKDNSAMYLFCSWSKVDFFKQELEKYFKIKNMIVWVKNNHSMGDLKGSFGGKYEIVFLVTKGKKHFNGKRITDIWEFDRVNGKNQLHQNQKPLELIKQCIEKHSNPNDIVFDGFMGSGTTALACLETNRNFLGFELDNDYYNVAQERISTFTKEEKEDITITHESQIDLKNMDCVEGIKELEDNSIDAIITDPPYNIAKENNFKTMGRAGIDFGEWDKGFDTSKWIEQAIPKVKKGGNIVIFIGIDQATTIMKQMESLGCEFKDIIRMEKTNPMPRNRDRRFIFDTEYALYFVKKGGKWTFNRLDESYERPLIKTPITPKSQKVGKGHPTQKPLYAMEWLIERLTNEGDVVLDPFSGSGTTAVACKSLGRDFKGFELEKEYYEMAIERLK